MEKKNNRIFVYGLVAVLLIINVCYIVATVIRGGLNFGDFTGQRILCAYVLKGINPFPQLGITPPLLPDVGVVPSAFSTTPWGLVLGNLFYPAYMPLGAGKVYIVVFYVLLLLFATYSLVQHFSECSLDFKAVVMMLALTSQNVLVTVVNFNAGSSICLLLVLACLYCDERPMLAGIALAFAMVKPQAAGLFCLAFLLQKRIKPLVVAAVIDLLAWVAASVMVKTLPLTLLAQFFSCGVGGESGAFYGIFTLLLSPNVSTYVSMIAGIAFVVVLDLAWRRKRLSVPAENFFRFYPASIATVFWCYIRGYDLFTLVIPTFLCLWIMLNERSRLAQFFWFCMGAYCYLERSIVRAFGLSVTKLFIPGEVEYFSKYGATLYSLGLIAISLVMLKKLNGGGLHDGTRV